MYDPGLRSNKEYQGLSAGKNPGFKCWKEIQVCGGEESVDTRMKEELSEGEK